MNEHARIARYFAPLTAHESGSFNLTDDAAVLTIPAGKQLVVTTDSVIEHLHVLAGATPEQFAQKLMRRNLSDLAAMGSTPWRYTINLHTPPGLDEQWFAQFCAALAREQASFGLTLIGGDSTSAAGPIHTTMTCMGLSDGQVLRRQGAHIGDAIYVSGALGGAAYALAQLQQHLPISNELAARYHCPEPRLALGAALRGMATSCLDCSDGLLADVTQLMTASSVGATLHRDALPVDEALRAVIASDETAWRFALSGGDDYELIFTAPPSAHTALHALAQSLALPITRIGEITAGTALRVLDEDGNALPIPTRGWEHR